jgi:hypothetical protein
LTPSSRRLLRACGYDDAIVARLAPVDARFFVRGALLSLAAALVPAVSMAYGATLTLGAWAAPALFVVVVAFVLNLLRLHHAGSGYPLHHPIEGIDQWRPAAAAVVVLFVLGVFFTQPLVLLVLRPWLDEELAARASAAAAVQQGLGVVDVKLPVFGLIARSHAAWDAYPGAAVGLSLFFSLLVCAPTWIRRTGARAVRLYESERWIAERELVDDAWAENLDAVTAILGETAPGFSGRLQIHHADPPYNTRPLLFGLDPALLTRGKLRFVRSAGPVEAAPSLVPASAPPAFPVASAAATPVDTRGPDVVVAPDVRGDVAVAGAPAFAAMAADTMAPLASPTPSALPTRAPSSPSSPSPPSSSSSSPSSASGAESWAGHTAVLAGRRTVAEARGDVAGLVLFLTVYLERPRDEVLTTLAAAPDDAPLYKVFPEWNKLPTLLLKSAGFALEAGLAPLIAIAVDKPVDQVERRLRAAPRDKKVSGVFAPELARRLLRAGSVASA